MGMCLLVKVFGQKFSKTKQGGLGRYHITVISLCQFHIQDFPRPFESIPTDCTLQYYTTNTRYMLCCSILALWETLGKKSAKIQNPVNMLCNHLFKSQNTFPVVLKNVLSHQ